MIDPAPTRIELRHLRSYVAVAEERHFRRAAERLHISQPPLSAQIKALEEALGVRLLERDRRNVVVTAAGEAFLDGARRVLEQMDLAADAARRAERGEIGRLTVGFVGSSLYGRLPELLRAFRTAHPDVGLGLRELSTAAQVEALESGSIDVGFLRPPVVPDGITILPLLEEDLVALLPEDHPLVDAGFVSLGSLRDEPFVLLSHAAAPGLHDAIVEGMKRVSATPVIAQEAEEMQTVVGLVAAGLGVSVVPASVRALDRHDVVYRELSGPAPRVELALAHREGDISPTLAAFLSVVRELVEAS